jgi:phosphohistidine phosphatase
MRHANPAGKAAGMSDHDRPLDARGQRDAQRAAQFILGEQAVPDIILSSTAARARQTAEAVCDACGNRDALVRLPELYLANHAEWLNQIRLLSEGCETVMLVGHNPGLEGLVEALTGEKYPMYTSSLARVSLAIEHWKELEERSRALLVQRWQP